MYRGQPSKLHRGIRVEKSVVNGATSSGYVDAVGDGTTMSVREASVFRYEHCMPYELSDRCIGVLSLGMWHNRRALGESADRVSHFFLLERIGRVCRFFM